MARFWFLGQTVELPAVLVGNRAETRDTNAWQACLYSTVCLTRPVVALRAHTNARAFPGRDASAQAGAWMLIGDVIHTASELASSRSLPARNPQSMTAFSHTSEAHLSSGTVLNIGLASAKFGGVGGGFQAEYVRGPPITFVPLTGKHWHSRAGRA